MKKIASLFLALALLCACAPVRTEEAEIIPDVSIKEKMFIAQCNEIYLNADDYLGKAIELEGLMSSYTDESTNTTYYMVMRLGPGCCGNDGTAGFEVIWPEENVQQYPTDNEWVRALGRLERYTEGESTYLRLVLVSLDVLEERGEEFVSQ